METQISRNYTYSFKKLVIYRLISENILAFLLQYIGLMFSTLSPTYSPIWFAVGTATAFILLRGITILPGIWLGTLLAYYFQHLPILNALICATLFTAQTFILLKLIYRYIGPTLIFYDHTKIVRLILITFSTTAITTTLLIFNCYQYLLSVPNYLFLFFQWWLANINGILFCTCALITLDTYFPQIETHYFFQKKLLLMLIALISTITLFLITPSLPTLISIFCVLLLISHYFYWCGTIFSLAFMGFYFCLAAYLGVNLFREFYYSLFLETMMTGMTILLFLRGATRVKPSLFDY